MAYSYAAIFASESISTLIAIYLGESIIANEVLAGTKGRAMVRFSEFCLRVKGQWNLQDIFFLTNHVHRPLFSFTFLTKRAGAL
jgi:hypothetical protein